MAFDLFVHAVRLPRCRAALVALSSLSILTLASSGASGLAQAISQRPVAAETQQETQTDLSIGVPSLFTTTRETSIGGGGQYSDQSYFRGVQGTFHRQYTPLLGYNVNASWARAKEPFSAALLPGANPNPASLVVTSTVPTNIFEFSGAYVIRGPFISKRVQVFGQVGGGVLFFRPGASAYGVNGATRGAALGGAGLDYNFSPRLGVRAEYRSLYYEDPSLRSQPANAVVTIPNNPLITLTNEFTLSVTYRLKHFFF